MLQRFARLAGFSGSGWFFGFLAIGGGVLILAAVGGYFSPPIEIAGGPCCATPDGIPAVWTPALLALLYSGGALTSLGVTGLLLHWRFRSAREAVRAEGGWASFIGGLSGWCLGVAFLVLALGEGRKFAPPLGNGLPYGSYIPLEWGAIVLLALTAAVWGRGLYRAIVGRSRRATDAIQEPT